MIDDREFAASIAQVAAELVQEADDEELGDCDPVPVNLKPAQKLSDVLGYEDPNKNNITHEEHERRVAVVRKTWQEAFDALKKEKAEINKIWEGRILKEQSQKHAIQEERNKLAIRVNELEQSLTRHEATRRQISESAGILEKKLATAEQKLQQQAMDNIAIAAGTAQADAQVMREAKANASAAARYKQSLKGIARVLELSEERIEDRADLAEIIKDRISSASETIGLRKKIHSLQSSLSRLRNKTPAPIQT